MSSVSHLRRILSVFALLGGSICGIQAQGYYIPEAGEYPLVDPFRIPGDQVRADLAIRADGGFVVWEDNATDGDGMGISARRLNSNLSRELEIFRVNVVGQGDQENPKVALLKDGGAVFVWQGGGGGKSRIYARFLGANGAFVTEDVLVNSFTGGQQIEPSVACLEDGSVVVVWGSRGQDDGTNPDPGLALLQGVYAQLFSPTGQKIGGEFLVNQTRFLSQRNPVVSALPDGGFVVGWASEKLSGVINARNEDGQNPEGPAGGLPLYGADIFFRMYDAQGVPGGNEQIVNGAAARCGSPALTVTAGGGFAFAWCQYVGTVTVDGVTYSTGWNVFYRSFTPDGQPRHPGVRLNSFTYGDQLYPKIAALGSDLFAVWTSLGQDGFREGVFGRFATTAGELKAEVQVNTGWIGPQKYPTVATDGNRRFLAAWSGFVGGVESFDIFAQRYAESNPLEAPAAPFVLALSQSRLSVTWSHMDGFPVAAYLLYKTGAAEPLRIEDNRATISGLAAGTEHSFRLGYELTDGRTSPLSVAVSGRTWGEDGNFDGLPDDWQALYWGDNPANWPAAHKDSDGDGASDLMEFLAGTDPTDPESALTVRVERDDGGWRLKWSATPGAIYQVQSSEESGAWVTTGQPRLAVEGSDSVAIEPSSGMKLYRVLRLR